MRAKLAADVRGLNARISDVMTSDASAANPHQPGRPEGESPPKPPSVSPDKQEERANSMHVDPMWAAASAAMAREPAPASVDGAAEREAAAAEEEVARLRAKAEEQATEAAKWINLGDASALWQLVQAHAAAHPPKPHPDAQPVPVGAYDLPAAVALLAAAAESDEAALAATHHSAQVSYLNLCAQDMNSLV